ncbi:MAG TPA: porin family protein [bacterium]|jgi:hypothetical protein
MKRSLAALCALGFIAVGSVFAQSSTLPLPTFGVRGGINIARERLSPSADISKKSQTGGAAGVNYEFSVWQPMNNPATGLSLRTDLLYVRAGGRFVSNGITEKDKVDQLRLAPFLVYRFAAQKFVPFIQAGPYAGIDLSHKYTLSGNVANINVSQSGTIPNWRNGDFGLNAGLGFKIPTPAGAFSLDGRYSWGLINKFNNGSNNVSGLIGQGSGLKRHSDGVLIMAGYDFNFMHNRY